MEVLHFQREGKEETMVVETSLEVGGMDHKGFESLMVPKSKKNQRMVTGMELMLDQMRRIEMMEVGMAKNC